MSLENGLILKNVSKRFGAFQVLQEVSAAVPSGKVTAFIGPNGAGKTTLFHVIAGNLKLDSGSIIFEGQDISDLPSFAVARRGIGRQFQDARVFSGLTVLENVVIALLPHSEQQIWQAWLAGYRGRAALRQANEDSLYWLEFVGLTEHRKTLARELSFGQQKLLSLARLFAQGSRFLLLDEPTAGVSHQMIDHIMKLVRQIVKEKGVTIALVEHNMYVVRELAYWIHFLHEGRVAFSGKSEHVLGNRNVREIYMGL